MPAVADPGYPAPPANPPKIALFSMSPMFGRGIESSGWLRWVLDQWDLPYRDLTANDIAAGRLAGNDVLLVPDGYATRDPSFKGDPYGIKDLGPAGHRRDPRVGAGRRPLRRLARRRGAGRRGGRLVGDVRRRRGARHLLAGRADPDGR